MISMFIDRGIYMEFSVGIQRKVNGRHPNRLKWDDVRQVTGYR